MFSKRKGRGAHRQTGQKLLRAALRFARVPQEERRRLERRHLTEAAEIFMRHHCKGLPWQPADDFAEQDGFVFSKEQVERHARHLMRTLPVHYAPFIAQWDRQQPTGATI
jgi:hypothetical protein